MAKKGVYKISGNSKPKVGEKTFFNVDEWYPSTPHSERNLTKVYWELFIKDESGNGFRTTNIKKKGINHFTFGKNAHKFIYKVEGYLHEPEGNSPMSMIVQPQKDEIKPKAKEKDILGVSLTYQDGSKISKPLSYKDQLKATAKCDGMVGESIVFNLWEDDSEKAGHHKNNQYITKSPAVKVNKYGKAEWIFSLSPTFITLANKKEDEKKQHEYYVTAEYNGRVDASGNVNVNNPEIPKPIPSPSKPKPKPKENTAKFPSSSSSPKRNSDPKGKILSAEFVNGKGEKISSAKIGNTVSIKITSKNMVGKVVMVRIYEDDNFNDDFLFGKKVKISNDIAFINNVQLTNEMYDEGKRWEVENKTQHFFIEVEHLSISTESQRIDVSLNEEPKKIETPVSAAKIGKTKIEKGDNKCVCQQYNLIWGQKVSCDFRKKVVEICKDLWGDANKIKMANNLMAVFAWESGGTFKPDAPNQANSGGTGLIQFMPSTAKALLGHEITVETVKNYYGQKRNKKTKLKEDWYLDRVKEFADMTAIKQLDYVKKYFEPLRGKTLEFIDFYLQVLFPASSGLPEHVVFADSLNKLDRPSENDKLRIKRVSAYSKNSGMDLNKDGKLMKSEIKISVQKYITEGLPYIKITKCENSAEKKSSIIAGKCTEGTVVDGFIENHLVTKHKVDSCNKNIMTKKVAIVVLHRTAGGAASGTLTHMKNEGYGAHFVVDYDGTVFQTIGLNKRGSHIGKAPFQSTINAGWGNSNSIGIETCGYSLDRDGNKRVGKKYDKIPHHHWEPVTNLQAKSVACLLKFLLNHFSLAIDNVKVHEKLCSKEPNEGQNVYDAMLPYFNYK